MKKSLILLLFFSCVFISEAQIKTFRFAFLSDTHISGNGIAEEDLRRTVNDINAMDDVAFVVITGDITELGTPQELKLAKQLLDSLDVPYYIIPGNHDTGWSESGGFGFVQTFGSDRFLFDYGGIRFVGCASGPYVRMSDGHVPRDAVNWLDSLLKQTPQGQPLIFLNHYPLDNGLDNWYEITDRLKQHNTLLALCGHGHSNRKMSFEDIPAIMGRSNLRARAAIGGYNLVDITGDSAIFQERRPGVETLAAWARVKIEKQNYQPKEFPRPDYAVNNEYPFVKPRWTFQSSSNVISTPAVANGLAIFGNQEGRVEAVDLSSGRSRWSFRTGASIFSSPAVSDGRVVFGSADGFIYCLRTTNGKLLWKTATGAAVLGSPLIVGSEVFIGGSDGRMRSLFLANGAEIWSFEGLAGPVVSMPVRVGKIYDEKIVVGAWDTRLYALGRSDGKLEWKWSNGSGVRHFSPASCIPVTTDSLVYVVAPDKYITAIHARTGTTVWRSNECAVRESLGLSEDGKLIFAKTMNDTLVAFHAGREKQGVAWKMHCGYGYDHVPSMPVEKDGQVFFGTRSGVVYCTDPVQQKIIWKYKLDNSMVNTVRVLDKKRVLVSTMDGKVSLLQVR